MSKKDYIKFAAIIKAAHAAYTDHAPIYFIQEQLAAMCANDNPNFDLDRFNAACRQESK